MTIIVHHLGNCARRAEPSHADNARRYREFLHYRMLADAARARAGLDDRYPHLETWFAQIHVRPAYRARSNAAAPTIMPKRLPAA